jgi:histidine triad (HIT) family protein
MVLTSEQIEEIKQQLIAQTEKLPQENKEEIKQHILDLNEQQLKEFLKQNKIKITDSGQLEQESSKKITSQCVFCSIAKNEVSSYKIAETNKAIAILEINPLSKGHSIVLPLEHIKTDKLLKSALSLAQKISKRIKTKLKPEDIKIETSSFQEHFMVNIIPIYSGEKLEKHQAKESDLKKLQSKLETKKRSSRKTDLKTETNPKITKSINNNIPQINFRIP